MVENMTTYSEGSTELPDLSEFKNASVDSVRSVAIKGHDAFNAVIMDIETEGVTYSDEVTLIGLRDVAGAVNELYVRSDAPADEVTLPDVEQLATTTESHVSLTMVEGEKALFDTVRERVLSEWKSNELLVTYNGSNFDIPHLLIRSEREYEQPHPFRHVRHVDPYTTIRYDAHTSRPSMRGRPEIGNLLKSHYEEFAAFIGLDVDDLSITSTAALKDAIEKHGYTEEQVTEFANQHLDSDVPTGDDNSLDGVYEMITKDTISYEPFESSAEAVSAWETGNVHDIALHNLADLMMTERVYNFALRQLSPPTPDWI